jgi:hypothetical protein
MATFMLAYGHGAHTRRPAMSHDLIARNSKSRVRGPVFFVGIAKPTNGHGGSDEGARNIYRMGRVYGTILYAEEVFFLPLTTKPSITPCDCADCRNAVAHV